MTQADLQQYLDQLLRDNPVDPLYVPRRFTALPESGSVSSDLDFRSYGMLREREPKLEELLTHPAIAIVADPGGGKSVVVRAALRQIAASGERVPVFGEVKQYRGELQTLFRTTAPADILEPTPTVDGALLRRTYLLDGIDEIPTELLKRLGAELREFIAREPQGHFICTARQAFYVANRDLLPSIPAVFHILPLADDDIEQYATCAGLDPDRFKEAIQGAGASEEVRNPFILAVMVERFRAAGQLSKLRSDNLNYMVDRLIQSRPQVNAHRQRRALRMLGVAMETYSRNELTEAEALRVIREAMRITEQESRELLNELYGSILKRTGNGLSFLLASYGEYLAAEALEDAQLDRLKELAFLDAATPNDSWGNAVSYLVELNPSIRKAFVRQYPFWTLSASPVAFSDLEKDTVVNQILNHDEPYFRRTTTFHDFNRVLSFNSTLAMMATPPVSAYLVGLMRHDNYAKQTAELTAEAVLDAGLPSLVLKDTMRRLPPSAIPPHGDFSDSWFRSRRGLLYLGPGGFPSGHAMGAFSVATIFAERYRQHRWVRWVAYGGAGLIAISRVTGQAHFPSDVFAGAAIGYSTAHYVVLRPR